MEVSGIEGNYRSVCEVVMMVLREQRDSVMAMLEAFVHDPLINWGLIVKPKGSNDGSNNSSSGNGSSSNKSKPITKKPSNRSALSTLGPVDENEKVVNNNNNTNNSNSNNETKANTKQDEESAAPAILPAVNVTPMPTKGMKRSKRASTKLSMQGGIKLANVHDALVKGDEKLALSLSSSGLAQSFAGGRSSRGRSRLGASSTTAGSKMSGGNSSGSGVSSGSMKKDAVPIGMLNQKAISVTSRVRDKLTGRDFGNDEPLDARTQVNKLILQATSHENLSQCYIGWCPFW